MNVKVIIVTTLFIVQGWGAVLHSKEYAESMQNKSYLHYHPNMTSMWMVDEYGRMIEVYLTAQPRHNDKPLDTYEDKVFFYLYTRKFNSAYQMYLNDFDRLRSSTFNANLPTKVIIHGFMSNFQSPAVQLIQEAYLNSYDVNVVAVDWSMLSGAPWYYDAVQHTNPVGKVVAEFIEFLVKGGTEIEKFHLIGHSLGAHVVSFASNSVTSGRIVRISGLDPALPLFSSRPPDQRLDPTDADTVDCIHTCGGYLGFYVPLCSHDFYPNGGRSSQPGCHWDFTGICSHGRSYRYYAVSVTNRFTAKACSSIDDVKNKCYNGNPVGAMGDLAPASPPGLYYLETDSDYPY